MAKPKPKCDTCQRGERYFDGCSHPECPKRKNGVGCWGAVESRQNAPAEPTIEKLFDQHE
jgi:hypothetical protein